MGWTCSASPTTTPSRAHRSWPGGCRAGWSSGEELRTHAGEIIGLFLTEHVPFGVPPEEAAQRIRAQGGLVYVPHPFDPMRRNLSEPALDALDGRGTGRRHRGLQRQDVAAPPERPSGRVRRDHELAAGAGSDAHVPDALGAAYVEMPDFDGPADFLAKLRAGPGRRPPRRSPPCVAASHRAEHVGLKIGGGRTDHARWCPTVRGPAT